MNKGNLTASILVAAFAALLVEDACADDAKGEKCRIIGPDGKSLIKAHMTDCAAAGSSCAGSNPEGDPNAYLYLPEGVCNKIKGGEVVK
ncbi:DUF2282 domain-containing protein [Geitlerinema splendidum]|jgi:uncharacterized membrane protein|nr:DUF2282 domain-containing protein [Geitlerinema splendidum]